MTRWIWLETIIRALPWQEIATSMAVFWGFLLLRGVFTGYVFKFICRITANTKGGLVTGLLQAFEGPLKGFFIVLGLYISLGFFPLTEGQKILLAKTFRSLIIVYLAAGVYNLSDRQSFLLHEIRQKMGFNAEAILVPFFSKAAKFLVIVLAATVVAKEWDFDVNGFITGLGLGGLAFALAAQDTIGNFFGGIAIVTDKPFAIGDWISTPDVEGTVEDINFRSTRVRTFAQAQVTVPNANLADQPITNWTRMGKRRISYNLGLEYRTPRRKLQNCISGIREMLKSHPFVHQETLFVTFNEFGDSSLNIFLYFFTTTTVWGEYLEVKEDINFKIMEILEHEGVSVAFPSQSVYMETPLQIQSRTKTGSAISSPVNSTEEKGG